MSQMIDGFEKEIEVLQDSVKNFLANSYSEFFTQLMFRDLDFDVVCEVNMAYMALLKRTSRLYDKIYEESMDTKWDEDKDSIADMAEMLKTLGISAATLRNIGLVIQNSTIEAL